MVWLKQIKRKQSNSRVPQILIISFGFLLILVGKADLTAVRYMQGGVVEVIAHFYSVVTEPVNNIESLFEGLQTVASLRNNENEVALTLISAIELNKETEIDFFNSSLKIFNDNYSKILENIEILP